MGWRRYYWSGRLASIGWGLFLLGLGLLVVRLIVFLLSLAWHLSGAIALAGLLLCFIGSRIQRRG